MSLLNSKIHFPAFKELIDLLSKHRQLTWEMAKREVKDRYVGQILGAAWAIGHPLIFVAVYFFLFVVVFKAKVGGTREMPLDFTTYFLSGFLPWLAFQESLNKSTTAIVSNANLVKQVIFPLEVLPVKGVFSPMLTQIVGTFALVIYVLVKHGGLWWTWLLLPVLMLLQCLWMVGASFALSAVGVYFRDLKDFVQIISFVGVFLMPVFYLPSSVPDSFMPILYANPFSYMTWCYQDVIYFGRFEHPWAWNIFAALSLGSFYVGYRIFRKLKVMFGNML